MGGRELDTPVDTAQIRDILPPLLYSGRKWKLVGQQIDKSVLDDTLEQYCWQHDVHYFRLCSYRTEQLGLFFVGVACSLCVLCGLFSRWSELLFFFSHKVQEPVICQPTCCRRSRTRTGIFVEVGGREVSPCSQSGSVRLCAVSENLPLILISLSLHAASRTSVHSSM